MTNHLAIVAHYKWKRVSEMCRFRENKMVRFQLVDMMIDPKETVDAEFPVIIPVFDMC